MIRIGLIRLFLPKGIFRKLLTNCSMMLRSSIIVSLTIIVRLNLAIILKLNLALIIKLNPTLIIIKLYKLKQKTYLD